MDFLLELDGDVVPLEVKAGINPRSKSLRTLGEQYPDARLTRTTLLDLRCDGDGDVRNVPLYWLDLLPQLLRMPVGR